MTNYSTFLYQVTPVKNDYDIREVYRQNKLFNKQNQYYYHYKKPANKIMNRQNFTHGKTSRWIC
jgi:hypothetical protein